MRAAQAKETEAGLADAEFRVEEADQIFPGEVVDDQSDWRGKRKD